MVRQVNYGLIGCGMMGHEHIRNIALVPGARISVVYDPVRDLRRQGGGCRRGGGGG